MSIITEVQRIQTAKADLKTAMKSKGVTINETAKMDTYASKVDDVYDAGYEQGKSESDSISPTSYASEIKFSNDDWAESDNVVIDMPNLNYIQRTLFYAVPFNKIKTLTVKSETPITYCNGAFQGTSVAADTDTLEKLILYLDFSQCTYFSQVFTLRTKLISIGGNPFNFSSATGITTPFGYCSALKSFRVVPNTIKVNFDLKHNGELDEATIQSVIEGLAELPSNTPQTLTMNTKLQATIEANQDWLDKVTDRNWNLAFAT